MEKKQEIKVATFVMTFLYYVALIVSNVILFTMVLIDACAMKKEFHGNGEYQLYTILALTICTTINLFLIVKCRFFVVYVLVHILMLVLCFITGTNYAVELGCEEPMVAWWVISLFSLIALFQAGARRDPETKKAEPFYLGEIEIFILAFSYIGSLFIHNKEAGDFSLVFMGLYLICYYYIGYYGRYISFVSLRKRVINLPVRRIRFVNTVIMLITALVILLLLGGAMSQISQRRYITAEKLNWRLERFIKPDMDGDAGEAFKLKVNMDDAIETPAWMNAIVYSMFGMIAVFVIYQLALRYMARAKAFSEATFDDDLIEDIPDEAESLGKGFFKRRSGGRENQIRRQYKKLIWKYKKKGERIPRFFTPHEIETYYEIDSQEAVQTLHRQYEEVRYGMGSGKGES